MKVLRTVRDIELLEGDSMAKGLFRVSNETDISFWFDAESKDRLMKLDDAEFWHQANDILKDSTID